MRLSRKNDAEAVSSRQRALGVPEVDLEPYAKAAESVTGLVSIPVSVAQLAVSLGEYELSEDGEVVETGRADEEVVVPLAHTEGGLTASVQRGAKAIAESGGCRTYVIADRITRASCFVCKDSGDALALARWIEGEVPAMREFLREADSPELSRYAVLREAKTHVVGPMCHVLWRFTTGDAFGANMMTRNAYALNMAYVLPQAPVPVERTILEANMGGDKKPSFEYFQQGHGKTVIAETTLTEAAIERVLRTTLADLEELAWAGTHGAVASGMQSVAFTPASAIAARLRGDRPGSRARRHELDGTRDGAARRGRPARVDPLPRHRGRHRRRRHDAAGSQALARAHGLRRAGQGLPAGAARGGDGARARDQRLRGDGDRRQRELLPRPLRARRDALGAARLQPLQSSGRLASSSPSSVSAFADIMRVQNNKNWDVFDDLNAEDFVNRSAPPGVPNDDEGGKQGVAALRVIVDLRRDEVVQIPTNARRGRVSLVAGKPYPTCNEDQTG